MIAIVTSGFHFRQGLTHEQDDQLLLAHLAWRGLPVRLVRWDDSTVNWENFDLVVIRSTWDYPQHQRRFLAWAERVAEMTTLCNPISVLRWNSHKGYLQQLAARGVPTVPTVWLDAGSRVNLRALLAERQWERAVIKPVVSSNAYATSLVDQENLLVEEERLNSLLCGRDMMVQPFFSSVSGYGERSLVFIDGDLTHAFRKVPALGEGRQQEECVVEPTPQEAQLARKILRTAADCAGVRGEFLFARVDLVPDDQVRPVLMELELFEPRLTLHFSPYARQRLAHAIEARWYAARTDMTFQPFAPTRALATLVTR